jgi:hypothetical protein
MNSSIPMKVLKELFEKPFMRALPMQDFNDYDD